MGASPCLCSLHRLCDVIFGWQSRCTRSNAASLSKRLWAKRWCSLSPATVAFVSRQSLSISPPRCAGGGVSRRRRRDAQQVWRLSLLARTGASVFCSRCNSFSIRSSKDETTRLAATSHTNGRSYTVCRLPRCRCALILVTRRRRSIEREIDNRCGATNTYATHRPLGIFDIF